MMLATETSKDVYITDIYRVKKKNALSRSKRDARQCYDGFSMDGSKYRPRPTSIDSKETTNSCMTTPQFKRRQYQDCEDIVTGTPLWDKRRIGNPNKPNLRARTPGKNFGLQPEDELRSSWHSSGSPTIANFLTPDPSSPLCVSSPGRNWQSSQDSARDVMWDCTSPVNHYIKCPARDSSNIEQLCRPWQNARCEKKKQDSSLLDKWFSEKNLESNCIQETRNGKKDTGKSSADGSVFSKELLELIQHTKQENLSSKSSRTPAKWSRVMSPNCSTEKLWGDEDESFLLKASLSPIMYADNSAEIDTTLKFTNIVEKNAKESTPSRPTRSKSCRGDDKMILLSTVKDSSLSSDELWNDDDETEVFSQEVLTLLEQKITEATRSHKCTPEEIARKRQDALSKRTRRQSIWNGRLRTPR